MVVLVHETIRILKLCHWSERSPKVKSMMAQYPDLFIMNFSIYIPNFLFLLQSAQLLLNFCYATALELVNKTYFIIKLTHKAYSMSVVQRNVQAFKMVLIKYYALRCLQLTAIIRMHVTNIICMSSHQHQTARICKCSNDF